MTIACLLFSLMTTCVFALKLCQPDLPAMVVSLFRVLVNLAVLALPAWWRRDLAGLLGDRRPSLWLRGLFGSLALMLSFTSIQAIGPGESSFLGATSGIFVALLSPLILGQRQSLIAWLAIGGAFVGVGLMFDPHWNSEDLAGRSMALGSGLLSALAYLMVARAGRSNSPESVIFYFCLVAVLLHLAYFSIHELRLPVAADAWLVLLVGGLAASGAQHFMTRAYQLAPATLVSATGYLSPVLSLAWGIFLFAKIPAPAALSGCLLVLVSGVTLPLLSARRHSPQGKDRRKL
ncbi:MAG: DMT family transporter [Methylococcaceae bacterium]|nr:DMT family transporter [Methylococcaceae bacterium]